jgi:predicted MPP superfamily phosphohydrolase
MWFAVWWLWKRKVRRVVDKRRARRQPDEPAPTGPLPVFSRRRFLVMSAAATPFALGAGPLSYAALVEPQRLKVRRYAVTIPDLSPELDGIRLVHISDTHYGPYVGKRFLRSVIDQANALRCDVAVLTGDYVHRTPRAVQPGIRLLRDIDTRLGAVAVLGNHDHWEGADACRGAFGDIGIPLIDNDRLFLSGDGLGVTPEPGRSICLAGAGDLWEDNVSFPKAFRDVPGEMPRIVLSHNPDVAEAVPQHRRIDLMCSGHTHGGQMRMPGVMAPVVPSAYGAKYAGGLVRGPRCPVVVSRGIGLAVLPARFAVPPELVVIRLRRATPHVPQTVLYA